jgi:radical SAM protein with 4Fe4S-binding SPASM domain
MIEVESRCNFDCQFCFNRNSFASRGHGSYLLDIDYIKKVIDNIQKSKIPIVRFTGGEPLLRDDLFDLMRYAKSKGLSVRLNTNGYFIKSYAQVKEMAKYLNYVLFAFHAYNPREDEEITGVKHSFERRIRAVKWFRKAGIKIIRVNTIATKRNIRNLEKFYNLFKGLKVDRWAVNRMIPFSNKDKSWEQEELSFLIRKLIKIKKDKFRNKIPIQIHIVNAVPLCAGDPVKLNAICSGGRSVDGHERFAIDPRRFAKPIYYMEENIGDPLDILSCWNHPFMKSLRNYKLLPNECKECSFLDKCKGGNRFCAYIKNGNYKSKDPLMDYSKIKNYIW